MKRITIISIVTASILLIGCGQGNNSTASNETIEHKTKTQEIKEIIQHSGEDAKNIVQEIGNNIKTSISTAVNASQTTVEDAVNMGENIIKSIIPVPSKNNLGNDNNITNNGNESSVSEKGIPEVFSTKCSGCHGTYGKKKALKKSEIIAGQSKNELISKIKEYKDGTRSVAGMGTLMKGKVSELTDADIETIASYLSSLK